MAGVDEGSQRWLCVVGGLIPAFLFRVFSKSLGVCAVNRTGMFPVVDHPWVIYNAEEWL